MSVPSTAHSSVVTWEDLSDQGTRGKVGAPRESRGSRVSRKNSLETTTSDVEEGWLYCDSFSAVAETPLKVAQVPATSVSGTGSTNAPTTAASKRQRSNSNRSLAENKRAKRASEEHTPGESDEGGVEPDSTATLPFPLSSDMPRVRKKELPVRKAKVKKAKTSTVSATQKRKDNSAESVAAIRGLINALLFFSVAHLLALVLFPWIYHPSDGVGRDHTTGSTETAFEFIRSHYHSHLYVNVSMFRFVRNGMLMAMAEIALLACAGLISLRWKRSTLRIIGYVSFCHFFVGSTAALFGGLDTRMPLIPDFCTTINLIAECLTEFEDTYSKVVGVIVVVALLLVEIVGFCALIKMGVSNCHPKDTLYFFTPLISLFWLGYMFLHDIPGCTGNEHHWVNFHQKGIRDGLSIVWPVPALSAFASVLSRDWWSHRLHPFSDPLTNGNTVHVSKNIEMRDGTIIAADVYLPIELVEDVLKDEATLKYPTFLDVTRYNRRMTLIWPFTMLPLWRQPIGAASNMWNWQAVEALVPNGYVVVVADARGTGGSTGKRPVDFSPPEIADLTEVLQWVREQFWTNGKVAMGGVSYDGMSGMQAAANGGVDAVIALFTPMDVTSDLIQPGGMVCSSFVEDYAGLTGGFERNGNPLKHFFKFSQYPLHIMLGFFSTFGRPAPIERQEEVVFDAIEAHNDNWEMTHIVQTVRYKDDVLKLSTGDKIKIGSLGVTEEVLNGLSDHNVGLYIVGGYCDSSSVRGAMRLYNHMITEAPNSRPKLTVGPWTHSGRRSCSPYGGSYSCFESSLFYDVLRYLDCTMGGNCWGGIERELVVEPVHYFEVGSEQWRASKTFPPPATRFEDLFFSQAEHDLDYHHEVSKASRRSGGQSLPMPSQSKIDFIKGNAHTITNEASDFLTKATAKVQSLIMAPYKVLSSYYAKRTTRPHAYRLASSPDTVLPTKNNTSVDRSDSLVYPVDYTTTSGFLTRWLVAQHPFRVKVDYGFKRSQWEKGLSFTSDPLRKETHMVGSAVVEFNVGLEGTFDVDQDDDDLVVRDAPVFAYLEEVNPKNGDILYVTEGRTLLSYRSIKSRTAPPGSPEVVVQPGTSDSHQYLSGHGIEKVMLTTEPISHMFRRGSMIRITLAGADVDNFAWEQTAQKFYDEPHHHHHTNGEIGFEKKHRPAVPPIVPTFAILKQRYRAVHPGSVAITKEFVKEAIRYTPNAYDSEICADDTFTPKLNASPKATESSKRSVVVTRPRSWRVYMSESSRIRIPLL